MIRFPHIHGKYHNYCKICNMLFYSNYLGNYPVCHNCSQIKHSLEKFNSRDAMNVLLKQLPNCETMEIKYNIAKRFVSISDRYIEKLTKLMDGKIQMDWLTYTPDQLFNRFKEMKSTRNKIYFQYVQNYHPIKVEFPPAWHEARKLEELQRAKLHKE